MEGSKEHYSACIQEQQSQDINPLHGFAGVRVAKKITTHTDTEWNDTLFNKEETEKYQFQ